MKWGDFLRVGNLFWKWGEAFLAVGRCGFLKLLVTFNTLVRQNKKDMHVVFDPLYVNKRHVIYCIENKNAERA